MRKFVLLSAAIVLSLAGPAAYAVPREPTTIYEFAEKSWAVGVVKLGRALKFREGQVLAFPSQIEDLVWAPNKTKPRNLMFVYTVPSNETEPFFKQDDIFFAPIRLLPETAYWKDNLPPTRRHEVAGGRRYVFRGDEMTEARKILADYLAAYDKKGLERGAGQVHVVVAALGSRLPVIREDSVRYLSIYPTLGRDFAEADVGAVATYLAGDAPVAEKTLLVEAFAGANVTAIKPTLEELAKRNDSTGTVARHGLDRFGQMPAQKH